MARKRYLAEKKKREESAAAIQAKLRGRRERQALKKQNEQATDIQAIWRGKRARMLAQRLLLEKAAAAFSFEYRAASLIKRVILKWMLRVQDEKDKAARRIQAHATAFRRRQDAREQRRLMRKELDRQNKERERMWAPPNTSRRCARKEAAKTSLSTVSSTPRRQSGVWRRWRRNCRHGAEANRARDRARAD